MKSSRAQEWGRNTVGHMVAAVVLAGLIGRLTTPASSPAAADAPVVGSSVYLPLVGVYDASDLPEPAPPPWKPPTGRWVTYTNADVVSALAVNDDASELWAATNGGVVKWDLRTRTYTKYTVSDGLPSNSITGVAFDPAGGMWFGTSAGLSFLSADGVRTDYGPVQLENASPSELPRSLGSAAQLTFGADGSLWVAPGWGGLVRRLPDGTWRSYDEQVGQRMNVGDIASDAQGGMWFAVIGWAEARDAAVGYLAADETWTTFTSADGFVDGNVHAVAVDSDGNIWVGTNAGLSRRSPDGIWTSYLSVDGVAVDVESIAIDPGGSVWAASRDRQVFVLSPDGIWTRHDLSTILRYPNGISHTIFDRNGTAYFATADGTGMWTARGGWQMLKTGTELGDNYVHAVTSDRHGRMWFGTNAGASVLAPNGSWTTYVLDQFPSFDRAVYAIAVDNHDNVWFGTTFGLRMVSPDGVLAPEERYPPDDLRRRGVTAIAIDHDRNLWLGSDQGAIRVSASGEWTDVNEMPAAASSALNGGSANVIAVDPHNNVWFGLYDLVTVVRPDGSVTDYPMPEHLNTGRVPAIGFDQDGTAWIGGNYGLMSRTVDGTWRWQTLTDFRSGEMVFGIATDSDHAMWVSTNRGLFVRGPAGEWVTIGEIPGKSYPFYFNMALDTEGNVWLGSNRGVFAFMRSGEPGETCDRAAPLTVDTETAERIADEADVDVYGFTVPSPFSRVEVSLPDPDGRLEVYLLRSCGSIGAGRLIGAGRHIGAGRLIGGEHRLVFDATSRTGKYYLAVRPRPGATGFPIAYRLKVSVTTVDVGEQRTLILTHEPAIREAFGLDPGHPELLAWEDALRRLAADPGVRGLVVWDLLEDIDDERVYDAYRDWRDAPPADAYWRANAVATALRDWIWRLKATDMPRLEYVVLAGDDRILPHFRLRIEPTFAERDDGWMTEPKYMADGTVRAASTVGAALLRDYTLTDDVYGSATAVTWGGKDLTLDLPDLAVGRLVERPADMTAVIDAFLDRGGQISLQQSLVAGYDFMQDGPDWGDRYLARAGLPDDRRTRFLGSAWTVDALRAPLLGGAYDLGFLALHSNHYAYETPGSGSVRAAEVAGARGELAGRLAYGLACHGGLNVPGQEDSPTALDFPEAWLRRGVTYIGSTGWAYGFDGELQYQEDLMAEFTRLLVEGDGSAVGEALATAKRDYFWDLGSLNHFHAKTLAGTVLYGLPMVRATVPQSETGGDADDVIGDAPTVSVGALTVVTPGLAVKRVMTTIAEQQLELVRTADGDYYTFRGRRPRAEAGEPLQPKFTVPVTEEYASGDALEPRGAVWLAGLYREVGDFRTLVRRAGAAGDPSAPDQDAPVRFTASGPYPTLPVALRTLPRTTGAGTLLYGRSEGRLLYAAGQYDAASRAERLIEVMAVDVYYGASAGDETPPAIGSPTLEPTADGARLSVSATDPAGVIRVVAVCDWGHRAWEPRELRRDGATATWSGTVPAASRCLLQAVDGAGNVAVADNDGMLYGR